LQNSYYYSRYPHIWGWACWRRVWMTYDVQMKSLNSLITNEDFKKSFAKKSEWQHWIKAFQAIHDGKIDTWDAQVVFLTFCNSMFSIYPSNNLISNIGFRHDATHTKSQSSALANLPVNKLEFPLIHPQFFIPNLNAEGVRKKMEFIGTHRIVHFIDHIFKFWGLK
jgi:hypothetical protein